MCTISKITEISDLPLLKRNKIMNMSALAHSHAHNMYKIEAKQI